MAEYTSPFACEVEGCDEFVIHAHAKRCWDHEVPTITRADLEQAVVVANQVARNGRRYDLRDELESAAVEAIWRAAQSYDRRKGGWAAWRDVHARSAARNELQRRVGRGKPGGASWAIKNARSLDELRDRGHEC